MQQPFSDASKPTPRRRAALRAVRHTGCQVIELAQGMPFPVEPLRAEHAYFLLRGDFDVFNRNQLSAALAAAVESPTMTVDLREVSFIDAGVLGALAGIALARLKGNASPLRIVNANARLKRLFFICRLQSSFHFEEACD